MSSTFGFESPQEAQQRVRDRFLQSSQRISALGRNASPGQQVGAALSNVFGGSVQKFIDTRAARKDFVEQLKEQGLTEEAAKAQAKETIEPQFREVRRAERLQKVTGESETLIQELIESGVPERRARAVGMLQVSQKLRGLGMNQEATQLSVQAGQLLEEQEEKQAALDSVKASTASTRASTSNVGKSAFVNNVEQRELLKGQAATAETEEERESLERQIGALDAKILKDTTIVGRTENDVPKIEVDDVLLRQQLTEIIDSDVLVQQLDLAEDVITGTSAFDASLVARAGSGFLGFLEGTFGREPTESQKEFIDRVTASQATPTIVSANIRHALTGAQMSAFEIKFLEPFLPGPNDNKTKMLAKIDAVKAYTSLNAEARAALIESDGLQKFFDKQIKNSSVNRRGAKEDTPASSRNPATGLTDEELIERFSR